MKGFVGFKRGFCTTQRDCASQSGECYFIRKPRFHWNSIENQRIFFRSLEEKLNIKDITEWYNISPKIIVKYGGAKLLKKSSSYILLLSKIYPNHSWNPFLFKQLPRSYWLKRENLSQYLLYLQRTYSIRKKEDWYRLSFDQFAGKKGRGLWRHGGMITTFSTVFPDENWEPRKFKNRAKKSLQRWLLIQFSKLFHFADVYEDYKIIHEITPLDDLNLFSPSYYPFEFDLFAPSLNLAIEYNGEHHFNDKPEFGPLESFQKRDEKKRLLAIEKNIDFIVIPYWWDQSLSTLQHFLIHTIPHLAHVVNSQILRDDNEIFEKENAK